MEVTLYADVLFLVNFSMDFISIWAAALLTSSPRGALRMSLAAALGASYGVFSVIAGLEGFFMYLSAAAVSVLMCLIAFGMCGGAVGLIKHSALIWGCGALLGGVMSAVITAFGSTHTAAGNKVGSPYALAAAVAAAAVYITIRLMRSKKRGGSTEISVEFRGKSIKFTALCDSGNLLSDPISGDPVIPVSADVLRTLTGDTVSRALSECSTDVLISYNIPIRIIPHKSAGGTGLSCALIPDRVHIGGKKGRDVRCLIAPLDVPVNYFGGCAATVSDNITV